jgi:hypothetical protein
MLKIIFIFLVNLPLFSFAGLWDLKFEENNLSDFTVNNKVLSISKGKGEVFNDGHKKRYINLRKKGKANSYFPFQWKLVNLTTGEILDQSKSIDKVFYGASSTKIMVGAAFLQNQQAPFSSPYFQDLLDMIVVSSNTAWKTIQKAIGHGDMEKGRLFIHNFTQNLGLSRTRGYWGYSSTMNGLHGNEINVDEFMKFMGMLYRGEFKGSELIFKIMLTGQKGYDMAKRLLPPDVMIANKGGRCDCRTLNPDTESGTYPDGSPFRVYVRHQSLFLRYQNIDYAMVILSDLGEEIDLSVMAAGLFYDFIY